MTTQGLTPEESLLAAAIRLAIKDARQCKNERLRTEAVRWLWLVAPVVAERAELPMPMTKAGSPCYTTALRR